MYVRVLDDDGPLKIPTYHVIGYHQESVYLRKTDPYMQLRQTAEGAPVFPQRDLRTACCSEYYGFRYLHGNVLFLQIHTFCHCVSFTCVTNQCSQVQDIDCGGFRARTGFQNVDRVALSRESRDIDVTSEHGLLELRICHGWWRRYRKW